MNAPIPVSRKMARLLRVLLEYYENNEAAYAADLMRQARMGSGSFYPYVARLEVMRRVDTVVECLPPDADRPPRTMYALTETGERLARVVVENYDFTPTWWGRLWRRQ